MAEVSPSMILSSAAVEVIAVPAIFKVVALTSPEDPYITALLFTIVPAEDPSIKLSSAAVEETPSRILSSAAVAETPSNILSSAVELVQPSSRLSSAAVEVTRTAPSIKPLLVPLCWVISTVSLVVSTTKTSPPSLSLRTNTASVLVPSTINWPSIIWST